MLAAMSSDATKEDMAINGSKSSTQTFTLILTEVGPLTASFEWTLPFKYPEATDLCYEVERQLLPSMETQTVYRGPPLTCFEATGLLPGTGYAFRLKYRRKFKHEGGDIQDGTKPVFHSSDWVPVQTMFLLDPVGQDKATERVFTYLHNRQPEDALRLLRKHRAELNADSRDRQGKTLLMAACRYAGDDTQLIELLLSMDADTNATSAAGKTALMIASSFGHFRQCQLLLKTDANLQAVDMGGSNALMWATDAGHVPIVRLLAESGADVRARDQTDNTALLRLSSSKLGSAEVAELLVQFGADVNAVDRNGNTALMLAALNGNRLLMDVLVKMGADPSMKNSVGHTVTDLDGKME